MQEEEEEKEQQFQIVDVLDTPISTHMILFSASETAVQAEAVVSVVGERVSRNEDLFRKYRVASELQAGCILYQPNQRCRPTRYHFSL